MHTQLSRIAFADASNNVVSLINVMEGTDGATNFGYSVEDTRDLIIDNGATNPVALGHTIELVTLRDADHVAQLTTWIGAQTPVRISGYGVDGFVYCHDRVLLSWADEAGGSAAVFRIKATVETAPGFDSAYRRNGGIFASRNLLSIYDRELGSSTLMAGTTLVGDTASFQPRVFTAPSQSLEYGVTPSVGSTFRLNTSVSNDVFFFPFVGVNLIASLNLTAFGGANSWVLRIIQQDSANAVLLNSNSTITATGIRTVQTTTLSGVFGIRVLLNLPVTGGAQDGDAITFNRPALNIGTTRNYTRF